MSSRRETKILCTQILLMSFALFAFSPGQINAQELEKTEENPYHFSLSFFKNLAVDAVDTFSSPKNWTGDDWVTFGLITGAGIVLIGLDKDLHSWSESIKTPSSAEAATFLSNLGDMGTMFGIMGVMYLSGEMFKSRNMRKTALLCLESVAISGVLVLTLKKFFGRSRPYSSDGSDRFNFFSAHTSFPSGHSQTAFAMASVIAEQSDSFVIDFLSYGTAALIAASRVHKGSHWTSDIFIGSAIGYFIGKKVCSLNEKRDNKNRIRMSLNLSSRYPGFSVSYVY